MAIVAVLAAMHLAGALPAGGAADEQGQAEMRKLTGRAYVTVLPVAGAPEATMAYVAKLVRDALPAGLFEALTVVQEGTAAEAKQKALVDKVDVFLHVVVRNPERVTYRIGHSIRMTIDGRDVSMPFDHSMQVLRTHLGVEMCVLAGLEWSRVKALQFSSAEVPSADAVIRRDEVDVTDKWGKAAAETAEAAVERVVNDYFFRGVTLRAVAREPDPKDISGDGPPKPAVRVELTNRSHCRVADAKVTVEQYNSQLKRWEPLGGNMPPAIPLPGPGGGRFGGRGGPSLSQQPKWSFSADVEPGETALSPEVEVSMETLAALSGKSCRLVLHAVPVARQAVQPSTLHAPAPKAKN